MEKNKTKNEEKKRFVKKGKSKVFIKNKNSVLNENTAKKRENVKKQVYFKIKKRTYLLHKIY